jgi:hypothetical protein
MSYAKAFFALQLHVARRVSALTGVPLPRTLLEYTNLYIRFGLGHAFDAAHPVWQEYVAGLESDRDSVEWTYRFYTRRPDAMAAPGIVATFGCFAYACPSDDRIRLHFQNAEPAGHSPLGIERVDRRLAELAALFEHVKGSRGHAVHVVGVSWLYNLRAYRRLFPPSYLATAHALDRRFQHMPLWGQFLDRHGETRDTMTRPFLERLARLTDVDDLDACFPFRVLTAKAPVLDFYDFYGISPR